jgi:colanic acid/amylovoran biosynthesis protein
MSPVQRPRILLKPSKTKEVSAYLDANGLPVDGFVGMSASAVVERKAKAERLDYKTTMVQLIKHAVTVTGMPVVLIPHSWPQGESKSEDLELAYELFERSECQEQVKIVKDDIDAKMLKAIISRSEILISSRFHSMIAALGTGVPTMVVGWSHKYREVMREVACEAYVCDFRKADFNSVSTLFNHLWENRHAIRKNIERRLPSLKDSAQQNLILLEKLLLCKAGHGKK